MRKEEDEEENEEEEGEKEDDDREEGEKKMRRRRRRSVQSSSVFLGRNQRIFRMVGRRVQGTPPSRGERTKAQSSMSCWPIKPFSKNQLFLLSKRVEVTVLLSPLMNRFWVAGVTIETGAILSK